MFKDMFNNYDNLIDGITYDDLITAVQSNEKEVNEKSIKKVFNEILEIQLQDAKFLLDKNMNEIIKRSK